MHFWAKYGISKIACLKYIWNTFEVFLRIGELAFKAGTMLFVILALLAGVRQKKVALVFSSLCFILEHTAKRTVKLWPKTQHGNFQNIISVFGIIEHNPIHCVDGIRMADYYQNQLFFNWWLQLTWETKWMCVVVIPLGLISKCRQMPARAENWTLSNSS